MNAFLQVDALLDLLEEPGDRAADAEAAGLVHLGIEPALDVAGPVDPLLDYRPDRGHLLGFAGTFGVGAVSGYEQACGSLEPGGVVHLTQCVGAAPGDQEERGVSAGIIYATRLRSILQASIKACVAAGVYGPKPIILATRQRRFSLRDGCSSWYLKAATSDCLFCAPKREALVKAGRLKDSR